MIVMIVTSAVTAIMIIATGAKERSASFVDFSTASVRKRL
jgi:hypothetical protein